MKIAQIAPLMEAVPPVSYGGTERVVSFLTEELVRKGHSVTLFASGDSKTSAELVSCRSKSIWNDPGDFRSANVPAHIDMMNRVRERACEFDILHFHTDFFQLPFFEDMAWKTVKTMHNSGYSSDWRRTLERYDNYPLIAISNRQRASYPQLNWAGTVHHGMPKDLYPFSPFPNGGSDGYLAFLGRMSRDKGPDRAIRIAKLAGVPLKIAARIQEQDKDFFHRVIEPELDDPLIEYVGEVQEHEKAKFLGNARAMVFPIRWSEPFGLVMTEAMACGTPVIAYPNGSVPEIVEDGHTGFIINSVEQGADAVRHLDIISRQQVRQRFIRRFSDSAMADKHVEIYRRLVAEDAYRSLAFSAAE